MKRMLTAFFLLFNAAWAQVTPGTGPTLYGYVKAWYLADYSTNQGGLSINMARLGVKGTVNEYAGYRLFVDFTRLGILQTKTTTLDGVNYLTSASATFSNYLLDADAFVKPVKNLTIDMGQFKVPFSTDNLRSGAATDFVNRPLTTNVTPGLRDMGFMATYDINGGTPVEISGGAFNGAGQNRTENDRTANYALRAAVHPMKTLGLSANYYGGKLSGAAVNIYDLGFDMKLGSIFLDGEFAARGSNLDGATTNSNSFFLYTYYDVNLGNFEISRLIPAVRYERYDPSTAVSNNEVYRTTFGVALEFARVTFAQFRLNYELFDYKNGSVNPNKLIVEMQTRF